MNNNELKRNASGYNDETPYKALTTSPKPGDVWVRQDGANMFVVAVNGYICNTLRMNDTPKDVTSVEIKHGNKSWWVNIPYIGFILAGDLVSYQFCVDDEQFMIIRTGIGEVLGLYDEEEEAEAISENEDTQVELKVMQAEVESAQRKMHLAQEQVCFYREMYERLLDKVIGRAC